MNYKLHPPIHASKNRFLDFKIYVEEKRLEQLPIYGKKIKNPSGNGYFRKVIGHTDGNRLITVKRIIGFGETEAAARRMAGV